MSGLRATFDLPPTVAAVPAARHLVLELLRVWQSPHDHDDAALLITELVSNVADHVGSEADLTVEVSLADTWLRLAVVDGSAVRPVVRELSTGRPRGRGLQMVRAIADRWGVEDQNDGKRVWVELLPPRL